MSNDMILSMAERAVYGVVLAGGMQLVGKGYMTADMASYIAGGAMGAVGMVWAWWRNRPGNLMDRAAAQMPDNSKLVIQTNIEATKQQKDAAHDLANSAGPNVISKVIV